MTEETIIRELAAEEGRGCWVALPAPIGAERERCPREATIEVYGLAYCELHGAEVKAGALDEFYTDAAATLERLDHPDLGALNPAAKRVIRDAVAHFEEIPTAAYGTDEEALKRAYPLRLEFMDEDFRGFDYDDPELQEAPEDWCRRRRDLIHKLMRVAFEGYATYIVEALERYRGHTAEQLSYVLQDRERRRSGVKA